MKNILKSCFAVAIGLSLLMTTGCVKDIYPQTSTVSIEQVENAPGAFDSFVNAITNSLTGSFLWGGTSNTYPYDYGYPSFFLIRDVMGQDICLENSSSEWYSSWYTCSTNLAPSSNGISSLPWYDYYKWIKSCNEVLTMAGEEPDESHLTGVGIAYCMRAMFYMDLARMYATKTYGKDKSAETVPIMLEDTTVEDTQHNPRATNEVMFAQILSDLDKAEEYLADYVRADKYSPDLSVVYGLKARAYLTMEDWANAELYAKKAQEGYSILSESEYHDRSTGFNTPNHSWMFAVTYKDIDDNINLNDSDSNWGSQMIIEVQPSGCGYASNYGTPKRIDRHFYETIPDTDWRKKCFVDFDIDNMSQADATVALSEYSDDPSGLLTSVKASTSGVVGGLEVKFRPAGGEHANQYLAFVVSIPLMRVEEMYLIEAEAAGRQDETRGISLLTEFAKTRDPNYNYGDHSRESYGNGTTGDFVNEVWWQRRLELWGEGFATFDIKRLDKGVIRAYSSTNHPTTYRWNYGDYATNDGNNYPCWMDFCIPLSETNYNYDCTNNPIPTRPGGVSDNYIW